MRDVLHVTADACVRFDYCSGTTSNDRGDVPDEADRLGLTTVAAVCKRGVATTEIGLGFSPFLSFFFQ